MSSGEDSETAEWEREQMLRGTQSRRIKSEPPKTEKLSDTVVIDATLAKQHVNKDLEKAKASADSLRSNMGVVTRDIAKSQKRIEELKARIKEVESYNSFFEELGALEKPSDILALLEKNEQTVLKLSNDQKELIGTLKNNVIKTPEPMDVDKNENQ